MYLSDQIDNKVERTAKRLKLMTHPVREMIIELLLQSKGLTVNEICERLNLHQPDASNHLILLRNYGVVRKHHENKKFIHIIDPEEFKNTLERIYNLVGDEYRPF